MKLWRRPTAESTSEVRVVVAEARDETNCVLRQMADLVIKLDASTERLEAAVERLMTHNHDVEAADDGDR